MFTTGECHQKDVCYRGVSSHISCIVIVCGVDVVETRHDSECLKTPHEHTHTYSLRVSHWRSLIAGAVSQGANSKRALRANVGRRATLC